MHFYIKVDKEPLPESKNMSRSLTRDHGNMSRSLVDILDLEFYVWANTLHCIYHTIDKLIHFYNTLDKILHQ